jgi:hypothetical protein
VIAASQQTKRFHFAANWKLRSPADLLEVYFKMLNLTKTSSL